MTLRRRSLLGSRCSPLKSPRRTAQTIHRRAMLQTVKQLTRPSADINSTGGKVAFGAASKANLKVVVRVRPLNEKELEKNASSVIQVVDEHMLVFDPKIEEDVFFYHGVKQRRDITKRQHKDQKFMFERIFGTDSTNQDVFESTTKDIIDTLLEGYNCSVFAYGATGAGKTFTMVGRPECPGITLLTLMELYTRIEAMEAGDGGTSIEVAVSYLEVYNEMVRDLLQPGKPLQVQDSGQQVLVPGLSFHKPRDAEHLMELLALGNCNRSQHPTDANAESSRSHAVFQVMVKQQAASASGAAKSNVSIAKLSMIDLAGSERAASTGCKGVRFREGANINKSLLALGNCINALADGKSHIPYRDSKLTRLLKDSLGGNCRSVMVAAVSMASTTFEDTFNTLRYSNRAKTIKTTLKKNQLSVDTHVSAYVKIVEALKQETLELRAKLEQSEHREAEQQRQAEQYEETIADLKRQLLEARENAAPSLLSSADNTHDGSSLAEPLSFSANSSNDMSNCTSNAERLPTSDSIFSPNENTSPAAACCSTTTDSNSTVGASTLTTNNNGVRGSGCSCPCLCQDAQDSTGDDACAAAAIEDVKLHREALQLQSDERQLHFKLHITKLKRSRLDIIAFAAYKLTKSVRKLASFEEELLERGEQTRGRLMAVTARLPADRPEKEDAERILRQEVSLLRSLVHDALHEVHESHCVQRVLLEAVRGLHVHLHATSQHSHDTQRLFQSVVSCLDEYRIAWADQKESQPSATTTTTTSCSQSGASDGGEGTVEEGRNGLPLQHASSDPPWLDVSWLTHISQDGRLQQSPAVVSCTAVHQLSTVRKSIMKGSSSTVSLCDVRTSPLLVHSITESAEQLRQSTLANTISNQRLSIADVDGEAAVKAAAASITSLAQLVVVTTAATTTTVTSSEVATTPATCSAANRGVAFNVTSQSRASLLQHIGNLNLPVMSQLRCVPATPVLRFPPPIIEETSPPALPGVSCISEDAGVYKSSRTEVSVTEATKFANKSCSNASSSSIGVLPHATTVNSSLSSVNSLLNSHKRMSMQRQSATRNLIVSADSALAATASEAAHDIPGIGCPGGFVSMLASVSADSALAATVSEAADDIPGIGCPGGFVSMLASVPSDLNKPGCRTALYSQTFSLTPDTDEQKALDSRLVMARLSDGRNVNSLSTDLNNFNSIPYSLVPSCLNTTVDLPNSTSGLYCNNVELNASPSSSTTGANPLVSSSTYNVNANSQHLYQNDVLDTTYVTSDVVNTVPEEQDVSVHKVTARQLLFTSPSTSAVRQTQQMQNSTFCIDSTEDADADGRGVLGSDPLRLLDAVPAAPSAPTTAVCAQMKLKGILKNAGSSSSVVSLAVSSQHRPDAPPPSCRPLHRSQSVRDSGGGRMGGGGGYTRAGAPLPEKSHAMRRILSFKARRLNGGRSNQENVTPSHGASRGVPLAHPHSAGKLSAPCNKLSASASCCNLSTAGVDAPGGGARLLPSTSVSNLTGVGAGGRGSARTVSSWRP